MSASIVLGFVIASLYGLAFYLLAGHGWLRLILYWGVGVLGFFLGVWLAQAIGIAIMNIGELNLVEGTMVSWLCLLGIKLWRRA